MPAVLTYPGVYIEEVPSGVRTISGVATSIAAFVGRTKLGPDNQPVVINSWADYERRFGGLWEESPLSVAVRDFFQNGGGQAVIVRAFAPTLASATEAATAAADAVAGAAESSATGGATDSATVAAAAKTKADSYPAGSVEATAAAAVHKAANDFATAPGNANKPTETAEAARTSVGASAAGAAEGAVAETRSRLTVGGLKLQASSPGSWANDLRARIDAGDAAGLFTLTVRDHDTGTIEQFANLSRSASHPRRVDRVLERESNLVRLDGALPASDPTASGAPAATKQWWEDSGSHSPVANDDKATDGEDLTDEIVEGSESAKTGLYALANAEEFNLLCLPPHSFDQDVGDALLSAAASYCASRRAVLLVDPPSTWKTKDAARSGIDASPSLVGPASANAAIYFPRILRPSPFAADGGAVKAYVPCGAVAGVIARTDTNRGIWKAPAGLDATLVGVPQLEVPLTDAENGELNPKGINCLRTFPAAGRVVWGARTRVGADVLASEWKYLNVRRTALYIEESLYRGTKWVVFEPNDEPLWASIRLSVGSFMNQMFRQGAFQGGSPRDAYFVRCDKDTTTQADIDRGIVNILVGFAPLKPAEFVVIRLQQMAGQQL